MKSKISYIQSGVDYNILDPLKKLAQKSAQQTSQNFNNFNLRQVSESRGESAFVWEEKDSYRAFVIEGLGTKNLVADEMLKINGKSYYRQIAQDTIATIVNDIITVGALPQVINAYFAAGGPEWFEGSAKSNDLIYGWTDACNLAGAVWGGGETPILPGIILPDKIDLAGACIGEIKPKNRLTVGDKLRNNDVILLIESSGIAANGLSLARAVAEKLPQKYETRLGSGQIYGETLLTPAYIYVSLIKDLFEAGVDIHYMVNITGHGFRKLMRANQQFTYLLETLPPIPPIFEFIQKHCGNDDKEMYGNFNMGAGFAIYLPAAQVETAQNIAAKHNFKSFNCGVVKKGPRQVIIKPKNITFEKSSLEIR